MFTVNFRLLSGWKQSGRNKPFALQVYYKTCSVFFYAWMNCRCICGCGIDDDVADVVVVRQMSCTASTKPVATKKLEIILRIQIFILQLFALHIF